MDCYVRNTIHWIALRTAMLLVAAAGCCDIASAEGGDQGYRHGISFFHELKYPDSFTHLDYVNPNTPKGGVLMLSTQTDFNTLSSPTADFLMPAPNMGRIYDRLLYRSGDEMTSFYGQLADGIRVAENRRAIALRLHPKAHWHDNVPITAKDAAIPARMFHP